MQPVSAKTFAISFLVTATSFAGNNNTASNNNKETLAKASTTLVITITDMSGKSVYTTTYTSENNDNVNIKLKPTSEL